MTAPDIVFDSSAVIALLRGEPGSEIIANHVGRAAISAVNLQEVVKALIQRGLDIETIGEIVAELRLDIRAHGREDAFAAAGLVEATRRYGRGLGDRSCMALAIGLGVPALTTDREWKDIQFPGLEVILAR